MKWPMLVVIGLGLVAALCVAALMALLPTYLRAPAETASATPPEVRVVVAARDLTAMQIVDADSIEVKTVAQPEAPEQYLSDPVQVLGKVLVLPVVEGQAFTGACFASEGSGAHLASALPQGKRAVAVALSEHSSLLGLLYPGCLVDVIVSYRAGGDGQAASRTLLENIQVLGVEQHTIVSSEDEPSGRADRGGTRRRMVTLMVEPEQARILQSAVEQGSISLAMRNPLDRQLAQREPGREEREPEDVQVSSPAAVQSWELTILRNREPELRKFTYAGEHVARLNGD